MVLNKCVGLLMVFNYKPLSTCVMFDYYTQAIFRAMRAGEIVTIEREVQRLEKHGFDRALALAYVKGALASSHKVI